ncbi:MAG: hypothetical protein JW709_05515 [Sedimentisphaerales bacterium]|nr:hypothetical protein [Sedimentisphaerales bacterium]
MSSQEASENPRGYDLFGQMPFVKLFTAFRSAIQPGRLLLALVGIAVLFIAGYILDAVWLDSARVMTNPDSNFSNEIEAAVAGKNPDVYRSEARAAYEKQLVRVLMEDPFKLSEEDAKETVITGKAAGLIKDKYADRLEDAADILGQSYDNRITDIKDEYDDKIKRAIAEEDKYEQMRDQELEDLQAAYNSLATALISGSASAADMNRWLDEVVVIKPNLTGESLTQGRNDIKKSKQELNDVLNLARAYRLAKTAEGQGIFEAFCQFKMNRFHVAVQDLLSMDLTGARVALTDILKGGKWLISEHILYSLFFFAIWLIIIAVFGGAICRMAALQFARDERIGPMHALKFSLKKLGSFITAPLVPLGIIILIGVLLAVGGLVGSIPVVGEIIAGILTGLALLGGFVIALVAIGLMGGFNLMYPAIAVEGSDSFDAISRSFSYLFSRPWRLGFYTLVAWIYGAICYLVVRLFVFVTLLAVHTAAGWTMNIDGSSLIPSRGKLDAIWPAPSFWDLTGNINWATLGGAETIAAAIIFVWVALLAGCVLAFMLSFFYTAHTTIYFLLRQRVDATDLEDVFIEESMEDLLEEAKPAPETPEIDENTPAKPESTSECGCDGPCEEDPNTPKTNE